MKELDTYIAIEGPIGVGKTSLAERIADKLNARKVFEQFEENPFLKDFYDDPESNAFQTQVFFLLQRYQQQQKDIRQLNLLQKGVVTDYMFEKDRLFADFTLNSSCCREFSADLSLCFRLRFRSEGSISVSYTFCIHTESIL